MDATLTALINADFEWTAHIDSIWRDTHSEIPELQRESRRQLEIRLGTLRVEARRDGSVAEAEGRAVFHVVGERGGARPGAAEPRGNTPAVGA